MSSHKDKATIIFRMESGEDHEVGVQIEYNYHPGHGAAYNKSFGSWDPPDNSEIELTKVEFAGLGGGEIPDWMFNKLYADDELKCWLEERAVDELNKGAED